MTTVTSGPGLDELVVRIVAEYREMPGLSLTPAQAARLCGIEPDDADRILCHLAAAGVLTRTSTGSYLLHAD